MRPRLLLALATLTLAAIVPARALAQSGFHGVYSRDGIDVWAVGDAGVVYRSLDRGSNWMSFTLGTRNLRAVAARNLTVIVVGDSGKIWRSTNSGGNWELYVSPGAPDLHALTMVTDQVGYVVGQAGTILKTSDGGASWSPQTSGASAILNAVAFADPLNGWAVGEAGTAVVTNDGGASWNPVGLVTTRSLYSVAVQGSVIWIVGAKGTAFKSGSGGGSWTTVNLKLEFGHDVRAAWIKPNGSVYLAGGGGFVRWTQDGGTTWQFAAHPMQAPVSSLYFSGGNAWAVNDRNRIVISSTDGGANYSLPNNAVVNRSWVQKLNFFGAVRGRSVDLNPEDPRSFIVALGNTVYRSLDEGETWSTIGTIPQCSKVNSFVISPKDSNVMLAAVSGVTHRLVKSDDYGQTWFTTLEHTFGEYGIPLEIDHDRPDTVYFGGDADGMFRSVDGGKNWERWSTNTFRSPCAIVCVPDSGNVILLGDGVTGSGQAQYFKSTDWGQTFTLQATRPFGASEIPGMACGRLRNSATFGTNWASGGVQRSTDFGTTWNNVHGAGAAWGVDVSRDDPNCVIFAQYNGGNSYLSLDGGSAFASIPVVGNNYSLYARDRSLILAVQNNGVYKMNVGYTYSPSNVQSVAVTAPNGGEVWPAGAVRNITWSSANLVRARIEYRRAPEVAWQLISEVDGYLGSYAWTLPFDATTQARVRVRDAFDNAPDDSSNATFTVALPLVAASPNLVDFVQRPIGSATGIPVTLQNTGTGILVVNSIATGTPRYWPGRNSITVGPGVSDTVGVFFGPTSTGTFTDTLTILSNAYNGANLRVPVTGSAYDTTGVVINVSAPAGGETWQYGTVHNIAWTSTVAPYVTLEYQTGPAGTWKPIVTEVPSGSSPYAWSVPFDTTDHGRVRVRDAYGTRNGINAGEIRLTSPIFFESPNPLYLMLQLVGRTRHFQANIWNLGTAPLVISSITSNDPNFWPGANSLTIPAHGRDTLGVYFLPQVDGPDTATFTFVMNAPGNPGTLEVRGEATSSVGVGDVAATAFSLWQNEPNPFTNSTLIRYALPAEAEVSLEVFNLQGQRVAVLEQGSRAAGEHSVRFGSRAVTGSGQRLGAMASGVYFYRFKAGLFSQTRKMLLLR